MEKCTVHRFKMRTNLTHSTNMACFTEFKGIEKLSEKLCDLKIFKDPVVENYRWGSKLTKRTLHITPLTVDALVVANDWGGWGHYFVLFAASWVLAEHDHAFRLSQSYEYRNFVDESAWLMIVSLDFIEFGVKDKSPKCISALEKCLKKHQGEPFLASVYLTMNKAFPNCLSRENQRCLKSCWIKLGSDFKPTIEFLENEPMWLHSRGVKMGNGYLDAPTEWMKDIISCFDLFADVYEEFDIKLKEVEAEDTQLVFFVKRANLSKLSMFLGTLTNFIKRKKSSTSLAVVKGAANLLPLVGSGLMIKDSIDYFKTGHPITGSCYLVAGSASLVADVLLLGAPAVPLLARATVNSSPRVVEAVATVAKVTAQGRKVKQIAGAAAAVVQSVPKSPSMSSKGEVQISDHGNLEIVFPRLAEDIASSQ